MTRSFRLSAWVAMAVLVGACAKKIVAPPSEARVSLAGKQATYRDWSKAGDLCQLDQNLFGSDLDSMNALLLEFLGQTSAGVDGVWSDENIALLEQGERVLPAALDLTQQGVYRAERSSCRFDGLSKTNELLEMGRRRLADAPELLAMVKAKLALSRWKESQPLVRQTAKDASCAPPAPARSAKVEPTIVFFAFEDEKGRVEWLFCDGRKVFATPGNLPAFEAGPVADASKKVPNGAPYVEAASKFPSAQVNRAPKLPVKRAVLMKDDPEPE